LRDGSGEQGKGRNVRTDRLVMKKDQSSKAGVKGDTKKGQLVIGKETKKKAQCREGRRREHCLGAITQIG